MDPLTILLLGGAALLVFLGLRSSSSTPSAQQQVDTGASSISRVGNIGTNISAQAQSLNESLNAKEFQTVIGGAVAGISAGFAAAGTPTAVASGTAVSSGVVTGAFTFGIGIAIGVAIVLWAKHEARIKDAKTENAAMNIIAPGWIETINGIIAEYNNGGIDGPTAAAELAQLTSLVYASLQRYNHMPGINWAGGAGQPGLRSQKPGTVRCDKHCTIGCCLFNNIIGPATNNAIALVLHHDIYVGKTMVPWQNSFPVWAMAANSKYGFKGTPSFVITVNR
jgi:hypothetical protein